jgi:protein ImuB
MARCFLSLFCPDIASDRLKQLVEWCDRYSPLVAQDESDGVILDITGCTHLYARRGSSGESELLVDLHSRLHRIGVTAHAAIADTWGAAWALARYGDKFIVHGEQTAPVLDPLPPEAFRLPIEIVLELRRLGLNNIAALRKIPRSSLKARFGSTILWRIDQTFQEAEDPLTPWRPPAPYRTSRSLAEPVSTVAAVEYVLKELLQEICTRLEKNHLGSRHMDLACYRVDGTVDRCEVRTSKPARSASHLLRLFSGRLENLWANFGFETFTLSVLCLEAMDPAQLSFSEVNPEEDDESFHALVDRLGMKLGFENVTRIRMRESLLPEHAVEFHPAAAPAVESAVWPEHRIRPLRMIDPPMIIEVSVLIPGESPVQFFIGERRHRIIRSEGPERLTPEWWRENHSRWKTRDYYRVEDDQGLRFWIFHESGRWFLHGHLP